MNSLEIREAKLQLIDMINKIPLPLEIKRMMVREVAAEVESATEQEINMLLQNRESEEKKESGESDE